MALITYRNLGPDNDPLWGGGQNNFLTDVDAVAQAVLTRLRLFEAEWWADVTDGTPYWQSILGHSGSPNHVRVITALITKRILETPFVSSLSNLQFSYDSGFRTYKFYAVVHTQFGSIQVTNNMPVPANQGLQ